MNETFKKKITSLLQNADISDPTITFKVYSFVANHMNNVYGSDFSAKNPNAVISFTNTILENLRTERLSIQLSKIEDQLDALRGILLDGDISIKNKDAVIVSIPEGIRLG